VKNRLAEIDAIRGITILLVVFGHTDIPVWLNETLRTFRMPLFFLVSGYLFSSRKYVNNIKELLKQRFWSLLVPYFSASVVFFLFWVTLFILKPTDGQVWYKPLIGMFYGNDPGGWLGLNGPLWFLVCLFCAQVIYSITLRYTQRFSTPIRVSVFILIGVLGFLISKIVFLPWSFDIAMVAVTFMYVGGLFKEHKLLEKLKPMSITLFGSLLIFIVSSQFNSAVDMDYRIYGNLILFYAGGVSGSILVMMITKIIINSKIIGQALSYLGKESLTILIFHRGFCFVILSYIDNQFFGMSIHWGIYLVIGITVPLLIGNIIKKIPVLDILLNGKRLHYDNLNKSKKMKKAS
jgi:fucose 4-O-acetylase-like acetyltransferase